MTAVYYLTTLKDNYKPRYVGQGEDASLRLQHHIYHSRKKGVRSKLYSWIKSRIKSGYEILSYKLEDPAIRNESEVFWISTMRRLYPDLLNQTAGGTGGNTGSNSAALRKFWQEVRDGKRPSPPLNPGKSVGAEEMSRRWHSQSPEKLAALSARRKILSRQMWEERKLGLRPYPVFKKTKSE